MNRSHPFHKLPECVSEAFRRNRCLFDTSDPHLPCAVHPNGVSAEQCLDFREDPTAIHRWSQFLGLNWVSGEDLMDSVLPHETPFDD